jgi:glycosyltransferase involved in cell wall biosynthesis
MSGRGLAAIILTKNEELRLPTCLESLAGIVSEVFVIDSLSTDRTVEIARRYGARVLLHPFVNQANQFNWALANLDTNAGWILRIDADERLSQELRRELAERLPGLEPEVAGLLLPLRINFLGRTMRHGDSYPVWLLRVWRTGLGRYEDAWMDERIVLARGEVLKFHGDLIHEIPNTLSEWTLKHDGYAARECRDIISEGAGPRPQLSRKLNKRLYLRLPRFHRAFFYWFYRYFFRLGFLDGKEGMIYHFLQGFWYRFLVDAKLFEFQKGGDRKVEAPAVETADAQLRNVEGSVPFRRTGGSHGSG